MIDDVSGARSRRPASSGAGIADLEGSSGCRGSLDPAVCITLAGRAAGRSGPRVAPGRARPARVAGGAVAGFGPGGGTVGAGFVTGNGAARGARATASTGGGADCDCGEEQGDEESAHTRELSAKEGQSLRREGSARAGPLGPNLCVTVCALPPQIRTASVW